MEIKKKTLAYFRAKPMRNSVSVLTWSHLNTRGAGKICESFANFHEFSQPCKSVDKAL